MDPDKKQILHAKLYNPFKLKSFNNNVKTSIYFEHFIRGVQPIYFENLDCFLFSS